MTREDLSLVLSMAALLGVIVQTVANAFFGYRQAAAERREKRHDEQRQYLTSRLDTLMQLRTRIADAAYKVYFAEAAAIVRSIDDPGLHKLVPQIEEAQKEAIDEAIIRLGQLLSSERLGR